MNIHKKPPRSIDRGGLASLFGFVNRDLLAILAQPLEADRAADSGEQGVVGALAHVHTGVDVGAALTHQDVAGLHELLPACTN